MCASLESIGCIMNVLLVLSLHVYPCTRHHTYVIRDALVIAIAAERVWLLEIQEDARPDVRCQDDDGVGEVHRAPTAISETALVTDLGASAAEAQDGEKG